MLAVIVRLWLPLSSAKVASVILPNVILFLYPLIIATAMVWLGVTVIRRRRGEKGPTSRSELAVRAA